MDLSNDSLGWDKTQPDPDCPSPSGSWKTGDGSNPDCQEQSVSGKNPDPDPVAGFSPAACPTLNDTDISLSLHTDALQNLNQ